MKMSVEIKEDKFVYSYEIGKNSENGEMPLNADNLCAFVSMLDIGHKQFMRDHNRTMNEIECMAYIETHPEMVKKYIEHEKKRGNIK